MRLRSLLASLLSLTSFAFIVVGVLSLHHGWFSCNIIAERNFTAHYGFVGVTYQNGSSKAMSHYVAMRGALKADSDDLLAEDADRIRTLTFALYLGAQTLLIALRPGNRPGASSLTPPSVTGGITAVSCAIPALTFALLGAAWAFARAFALSPLLYRYLPPLMAFILSALLTAFGSVTFVSFVRSNEPQERTENSTLSLFINALAPFAGAESTSPEQLALYASLSRTHDAHPAVAWALSMISIPLNVLAAVLLWLDRKETQYEVIP